ncbi:MAG: hypothetical protein ACFCBV_09570 [Phycisphaerales bacterium]
MDWRLVRLGKRALIVLALGATAFLIQWLRSPWGGFTGWFGTALQLSVAISATTLVLIAVRAIILIAFRPMRRRTERSTWPSHIAGYVCGWVGILAGVACLLLVNAIGSMMEGVDIEFGHVPVLFGMLLIGVLGILLISVGWAFGGLGPTPVQKTEKRPPDA